MNKHYIPKRIMNKEKEFKKKRCSIILQYINTRSYFYLDHIFYFSHNTKHNLSQKLSYAVYYYEYYLISLKN